MKCVNRKTREKGDDVNGIDTSCIVKTCDKFIGLKIMNV